MSQSLHVRRDLYARLKWLEPLVRAGESLMIATWSEGPIF